MSAIVRGFETRPCTFDASEWMHAAAMVLLSAATRYDGSYFADKCRNWAKWYLEFAEDTLDADSAEFRVDMQKRIEWLGCVIAGRIRNPSAMHRYRALGILEIRCALALKACLIYALELHLDHVPPMRTSALGQCERIVRGER